MQQSNLLKLQLGNIHVAIIMDGNGRWASERGRPRTAGHRAGAEAVRRVVEAAPDLGISTLTLYAFSSDNWGRPAREVAALMKLFRLYLLSETATCVKNGIRISVIGRRDRLSPSLVTSIAAAEEATRRGRALSVRAAIDYSSRDVICRAASRWGNGEDISRGDFARLLGEADHSGITVPDVDLLIRTGGEQRLSDFLLWECAYAELYFTELRWPDFGRDELEAAVSEFRKRERRFGRVSAAIFG
ncbi:MAG: di-trans,poly-cis-decaprenylcistransferase [Acidobacteria bacterium]|nr:di-trans,poly-cis-decaprenylcistransferase [Acidobacteriota bacterium]